MEESIIYQGNATLEEMSALGKLGYEFVIEDGKVTHIIYPREIK